MMVDTHAHIDNKGFDGLIDETLKRAFKHNINLILNIGYNIPSSCEVIALAKKYKGNLFATIGIHPEEAKDIEADFVKKLQIIYKENSMFIVGIGEIGIDLFWDKASFEKQKNIFIKQIEIAKEFDLPIVIHSRGAFKEIFEILEGFIRDFKTPLKGVFHCFDGKIEDTLKIIDLGFYISFSGIITYPQNGSLRNILKTVPKEKLLLETDSPYLPPQKFRGKRNEPSYITETYKAASEILDLNIKELELLIYNNANTLFKFDR